MSCADADCKYPKCACWSIKERNDPRYLKSLLRCWLEWYEANAYGLPGASALVEETCVALEAELDKWIDKVFQAHPNIDLDIEALEGKP